MPGQDLELPFGPLVVMSLFWKRTNLPGAIAGLLSGALTVIIWDYIPIIGGQTPYVATGLYSLVVGFIISLLFIVVVSLMTKAPEESIIEELSSIRATKNTINRIAAGKGDAYYRRTNNRIARRLTGRSPKKFIDFVPLC